MPFRSTRPVFASLRSVVRSAPVSGRRFAPYAISLVLGATLIWSDPQILRNLRDARWADRFVVHAEAALQPDPTPTDPSSAVRVDTDTSIPFPLRLQLTAHVPPLSLVGLGVRKVSFLRVKVYSAGFYVDEKALAQLDRVPGFATYTPQHLLTVPPADGGPHLQGEALIRKLLEYPAPCAIRIVPTRKTDFAHLRDGFTRAIMARQKLAHQAGTLSHSDDHLINDAMHALKGLFPAHAIPKGKALVLYRTAKGALVVEYEASPTRPHAHTSTRWTVTDERYQGKELGKVDDPWMSRELFLAYFADKDVISPKLKEDVAKGFEQYVHAKIGPA